jgi:uncharacterized lipoprotein YddW (UPF0748 family)
MRMWRRTYGVLAIGVSTLAAACGGAGSGVTSPTTPAPTPVAPDTAPPALAREMRGLWIATVANIDWPSRNSLTPDQQRAELTDILDRAVNLGLNTIVFHVRPAADAVYQSSLEPWAALLTGKQGTDPGYDPLALAVTEAHARGLELHAWVNPFRAGNSKDSAALAPTHVFNTRRTLVRVYGTQLWLDPGEPEVQDHSMRVIADIVSRYDIDAIHADDYFYPYQENDAQNRLIDFPDSASYARSGSSQVKADWRRANIDRFVERMYREVHQIKPTLKVGLSPFGIWRPGNPLGVTGLDAYATLYADSRKWLQQGWVDYMAPQLYWAIGSSGQSFPALLDWWSAPLQNAQGRHVWPGLASYRVNDGTASAFSSSEIPNQINESRTRLAADGHILYNTTWTLKRGGSGIAPSLQPLYATRALVPASPWLDSTVPATPSVSASGRTITLTPGSGTAPRWWYVRARSSSGWTTRIVFGSQRSVALDVEPDRLIVNSVSMSGIASADATWKKS